MLIRILKEIFERDLNKLKSEIELYQHEETLWYIEKNISNSAGNLCLHILGNLNTYIGNELGKSNYVRHRELEFSLKNIPKSELLQRINQTQKIVLDTLDKLNDEDLKKEYSVLVFTEKTTIEYLLVHLTTHLTYHLGQINYHRRLLDSN